MRFADVFAGLGGFHIALQGLGHECVFASEIDPTLKDLYRKNFGIESHGDIRDVALSAVPPHDILCAGFPCQPFSKAGAQRGLGCPKNGDLFSYVMRILRKHEPEYVILENVPNLEKHDGGVTWQSMSTKLRKAGYDILDRRFSPHDFGIPQIRDRIYIVGKRGGLSGFQWPPHCPDPDMSIMNALDKRPSNARALSQQTIDCLNVWQRFVQRFPTCEHLPTFPIWSMEFGATYPYETRTPFSVGVSKLRKYLGSHGGKLSGVPSDETFAALPSYARTEENVFPSIATSYSRSWKNPISRPITTWPNATSAASPPPEPTAA